jgi:hypothetical protein
MNPVGVDQDLAFRLPRLLLGLSRFFCPLIGAHSFPFYLSVCPYKNVGAREMCREYLIAISEVRQRIYKPVYGALYCSFQNLPGVDESRREASDT